MKQSDPGFIAYLPSKVRYDNSLPFGARIIYAEISALCNSKGYCWANNKYFADLYNNSKDTISRWISDLEKAGYIKCFVSQDEGNLRKIYLVNSALDYLSEELPSRQKQSEVYAKSPKGSRQKNREGIGKNAEHNSIVNNTDNSTMNNNSANAHFSGNSADYNDIHFTKNDRDLIEERPEVKICFSSKEEKTPVNKIPDVLKKPLTYTKEDFLNELEQKGVATWYDSFKNVWGEYIRHRKELRKPYKSAKSAAIGFKELLELSDYNVEAGTRLVERSIANGWQGLHPEKQKAKSEGKSKMQEQHEDLVSFVMQKRNLLNNG
jgi:DNA-binding transcriptional ArsR family regulator